MGLQLLDTAFSLFDSWDLEENKKIKTVQNYRCHDWQSFKRTQPLPHLKENLRTIENTGFCLKYKKISW